MGKTPPLPRQHTCKRDPDPALGESSRRLGHRHCAHPNRRIRCPTSQRRPHPLRCHHRRTARRLPRHHRRVLPRDRPPPRIHGYDTHHPKGALTPSAATTVEQLEDSPVITGEYFHEFALAPEVTPKHYIDVVSDDPKDSDLRPEVLAEISNLVREASSAYASHHYNVYHFLLTLSDVAGGEGLEHGQSSDNGVEELGFADAPHQVY